MPSLYKMADAFVLPLRGGEWAAPVMEAMACGLPVITTRWGNRCVASCHPHATLLSAWARYERMGAL